MKIILASQSPRRKELLERVEELDETGRGQGGFGSTGR